MSSVHSAFRPRTRFDLTSVQYTPRDGFAARADDAGTPKRSDGAKERRDDSKRRCVPDLQSRGGLMRAAQLIWGRGESGWDDHQLNNAGPPPRDLGRRRTGTDPRRR